MYRFSEWLMLHETALDDSFHNKIDANSKDDFQKMVYADWLEDHGNKKLADYIRTFFNSRDHLKDYWSQARAMGNEGWGYGRYEHPRLKNHPSHQSTEDHLAATTAMGNDVHNIPFMVHPGQNSDLHNLYTSLRDMNGNRSAISRNDQELSGLGNIKVSHLGLKINSYQVIMRIYKNMDFHEDLLDRKVDVTIVYESLRTTTHSFTIEDDHYQSAIFVEYIPRRIDPNFTIKIKLEGENNRIYKTEMHEELSPVPFSNDPKKGYGRIEVKVTDEQ